MELNLECDDVKELVGALPSTRHLVRYRVKGLSVGGSLLHEPGVLGLRGLLRAGDVSRSAFRILPNAGGFLDSGLTPLGWQLNLIGL